MKKKIVLAVLFSILPMTASANDAVALLNEMAYALHNLNYKGRMVYSIGNDISTLSIDHFQENGIEKEVVTPLDRNSGEYVVESSGFLLSNIPKISPEMEKIYAFDLGGMGKVAGRPCRIVLARPKDRKRYLKKYCIDLEHKLLLQYTLINQKHEPVERFMFTDFSVYQRDVSEKTAEKEKPQEPLAEQEISQGRANKAKVAAPVVQSGLTSTNTVVPADDNLLVSMNSLGASPVSESVLADNVDNNRAGNTEMPATKQANWIVDPLPKGYSIRPQSHTGGNDTLDEEHIVISDGLSAVSIFISQDQDNNKSQQHETIQSGATNILTKHKDNYLVTLVGEVPLVTLNDIFSGLKRIGH
jgi:sigma-E factor negative regulatory protein RseB